MHQSIRALGEREKGCGESAEKFGNHEDCHVVLQRHVGRKEQQLRSYVKYNDEGERERGRAGRERSQFTEEEP